MNESTTKVLHQGREVLRIQGAKTPAGHQIYEVDGIRCWACAVVGVVDQAGDPVLSLGTSVAWRPVEEVSCK